MLIIDGVVEHSVQGSCSDMKRHTHALIDDANHMSRCPPSVPMEPNQPSQGTQGCACKGDATSLQLLVVPTT